MNPLLVPTWLTATRNRPLLVVGPSLGTSAADLWGTCAQSLASRFSVLAWDLPGHAGTPVGESFDLADIAAAVVAMVDAVAPKERRFGYAGDSVGGAVGLQLLLDAPARVSAAVLLSTGARIGDESGWLARAETVRIHGTAAVVAGSLERWFSATTLADRPELVRSFATTLRAVDGEGYAQVCEALAVFDVRSRLAAVGSPVLAVAGAEDVATPVESLAAIADGVAAGRLVILEGVAHLPPVEAPAVVSDLLHDHLTTVNAI